MAAPLWQGGPLVVAGTTMLVLAGVLLYVAFPNRVNRAFALYLGLRGALNALGAFAQGVGIAEPTLVNRMYGHLQIWSLFALLYFALVFYQVRVLGRSRPTTGARSVALLILVSLVATEVAYLLRFEPTLVVRGAEGTRAFASALLVLLLAYRATTLDDPRRRSAALLFAVGLGLDLAFLSVLYTGRMLLSPVLAGLGPDRWFGDLGGRLVFVPLTLALVPLAAAIGILWLRRRKTNGAAVSVWAMLLAGASAVASYALSLADRSTQAPVESVLDGLWTLAFPILVAYAVLRHSMFDVDVKARFVIRQGTVGLVILGVAFVTAEVVANALTERLGLVAGGVAAGLVLLATEPLQRWGRAVAERTVPPARAPDAGPAAAYAEQVEIAYSDGALSPKDRRHLEAARATLGLSVEAAHAIELSVAARAA